MISEEGPHISGDLFRWNLLRQELPLWKGRCEAWHCYRDERIKLRWNEHPDWCNQFCLGL